MTKDDIVSSVQMIEGKPKYALIPGSVYRIQLYEEYK